MKHNDVGTRLFSARRVADEMRILAEDFTIRLATAIPVPSWQLPPRL